MNPKPPIHSVEHHLGIPENQRSNNESDTENSKVLTEHKDESKTNKLKGHKDEKNRTAAQPIKYSLLLLAVSVSLLSLGAGCSNDENIVINNGMNTSTDDLALDVNVEAGIMEVKIGTSSIATSTVSYVAALKNYGVSGMRFQFLNCSGTPGSLVVKKGAKFMIDNRDNAGHNIGIGSKNYFLNPYDFAVVSVSKAATINITCDGGGSARVVVEN